MDKAEIGSPNGFGLVNMIGNVAEMTNVKCVAKGGSWNHYLNQSEIIKQIAYGKSKLWLGFRCICEIAGQ